MYIYINQIDINLLKAISTHIYIYINALIKYIAIYKIEYLYRYLFICKVYAYQKMYMYTKMCKDVYIYI